MSDPEPATSPPNLSQLEQALRSSRELTQAVIDSLAAHIAVLDRDGTIISTNAAWNRFGQENSSDRSHYTGLGVNYLAVCHGACGDASEGATEVEAGIRDVLAGTVEHFQYEYPCHSPSAQRWFLLQATGLERGAGGAALLHINITDRKLTEGKLLEAERLKVLTTGLLTGQEEERRRLARELHDGLNQQVAVLSIELGVLAQQMNDPVCADIKELQQRTIDLSEQIRRISHQLHPAALEHLGLSAALRSLCQEFENAHELTVELTVPDELGDVGHTQALCLYRVAQECLRNIARHAGASHATLVLKRSDDDVELAVTDNGRGFAAPEQTARSGLGLASMEERVNLAGGCLLIRSEPGSGTRTEARVPALERSK